MFSQFLLLLIVSAILLGFVNSMSNNSSWVDVILILAIVFISGISGFVQNYKAEKSIEALKDMASPKSKVVREGVQVSEDSYSLKNLEKFYNFNRSGDVLTAEESIDSYVKYTISKDKKILDEIVSYNEQDCLSTLKLRDWLLEKRPKFCKSP